MLLRKVMFELGALPYAFLTSQPAWRAHGAILADLAEVDSGQKLLDLGCGPGESAFGMLERVPGLSVTGLDRSKPMIRIARMRRSFERERSRIDFVTGDAVRIPHEDESFDAVTGHSFLYLVPDIGRVLSEVRRVLKPGKRCVFLEPADLDEPGLLPAEILRRTLREPRFVASMTLWRLVSRGFGRFDAARFESAFRAANLEPVATRGTLGGLGVFGIARKPPQSSSIVAFAGPAA